MRRGLLAAVAAVLLMGIAYQLLGRESTAEPRVILPQPTATIGTGSEAVGVSADGVVLDWLTLPEDAQLPRLPLSEPPAKERLGGPLLQQALVLGAAPAALRPYVASSYYGESGVDVELTSGIELRFGDATRAAQKWKAAAAVLANPSITELDYVNLLAPSRPTVGGSGHVLPPIP